MAKEIKGKWLILAVAAAIGAALDLWTKYLAAKHLIPGNPVRVLGDALEFVLVYNKAAIFGLDPRALIPGFPLNLFFTCFMIVAIIMVIAYYRYLKKNEIFLHWGLAMVLPGAIGNLYDRIAHPGLGVVDFIKVDLGIWPFNPWPVFNLADAWVTIGVGLMIVSFILESDRKTKNEAAVIAATSVPEGGNATEEERTRE